MHVSIIIPTYNAQLTIEYCLMSCLRQLDYIKEIIIVDDQSTDDTLGVVEKIQNNYQGKIQVFKNPGKGSNSARNLGFSKTSGEFIQWLDADDELAENKLKNQVEFLRKETVFDIAYSDWILKIVDLRGGESIEVFKEKNNGDFFLKLLLDYWMPPHVYLLRRSAAIIISNLGGWNIRSQVLQDREYFTIGALWNLKFGYVQGVSAIYFRYPHLHSISKSKDELRYNSLLNLMQNIKCQILDNGLLISVRQRNAIYSNEVISRLMLGVRLNESPKLRKMYWRLFPGNKIKFLFLLEWFKFKIKLMALR